MRPRDRVGARLRDRPGGVPGRRLDLDRLGQERRAARAGGELGGELAVAEVDRALADQATGRRVPERGRAAVSERDLVAVGDAEQLAQPLTDPADDLLDGRLAVRGPHHARSRAGEPGERSWRTRDGPEPKRPSAGLSSAGICRTVWDMAPRR